MKKTLKPEICPFFNLCAEDTPDKIQCETEFGQEANYEKCKFYAQKFHEATLSIPLICPLNDTCPKAYECVVLSGAVYRECAKFSEWFWEQRAKAK